MSGAVAAIGATPTGATAAKGGGGMSFGEVLSCLNPLQYVPVVGTIYRTVTGDTIPATGREVGSLVFSGLTSGPVGVGLALGVDAIEGAIGFDEEKFGQSVLAALGIGHGASASPATPASDTALASTGKPTAFTTSDLAEFGLTQTADGSVTGHGLEGADALNAMELSRIATSAYAKAATSVATG